MKLMIEQVRNGFIVTWKDTSHPFDSMSTDVSVIDDSKSPQDQLHELIYFLKLVVPKNVLKAHDIIVQKKSEISAYDD